MLFTCDRSTQSIPLILFFIVNSLFSQSNPNANQKVFTGNITAPKDLEMRFEINPGANEEKVEKSIPKVPVTVKKSTKKLVTRQKRYTGSKSETIKPIKGLPKGKCKANSCKNGGVCQTMKGVSNNDHVISCLCRLGFEGLTCEKATTGVKFPKFLNGYLAFPEQILNDLDFRLSVFVKPANDSQADTVIAFKQSLKNNNFIVGLEQNQFIFRIESAKIRKIIRHQIKVEISRKRWYKVEIERKDNDHKLTVDDVESTATTIQINKEEEQKYSQTRNETNILPNHFICDFCLYLGGHPQLIKMLRRNFNLFVSLETSFIGCMRNLMIDEADIDMRRMPFYGRAVDGLGIDDCSIGLCDSATRANKCHNNGDCQVSKDFVPTCHCAFGFTGPFCDKEIKIQMLQFNGESYANYNGLKGTSRSQNDIFIKFKPISDTGILLYQGYSSDKRGDFLALYLINSYPWISYDLGSGTISMRSQKSLKLDEWHTIRFFRVGRKGTMIIDYGEPIVGFSPGSQLQLTIKQNLQLGGVDSFDNVSAFLSIRQGFKGCVHTLFVDHYKINLIEDIFREKSRNLQNCNSHQCGQYRKICWKGGECIPVDDRYLCSCPLGFIEETCQTEIKISGIRQPSFNGSSYLAYNETSLLKRFSNPKFSLSVVVNLKVIQTNRILLLIIDKSDMNIGQYFALIINSKSGINIDLNNAVDKSETNIIDNLPLLSDHRIQILKDEDTLRFVINDSFVKTVNLKYKSLSLFGFSKIFFGGTDLTTAIRMNLPLQSGLVGCIKEINLDNQIIRVIRASDGRSVAECGSRYPSNPDSLETRFVTN